MIIEKGQVLRKDNGEYIIKLESAGGCSACALSKKCMMSQENSDCIVRVTPTLKEEYKEGDTVYIGFEEGFFLKISMIIYLFPALLILLFAILSYLIASRMSLDFDLTVIVGTILGFIMSLFFVYMYKKYCFSKKKPIILKKDNDVQF